MRQSSDPELGYRPELDGMRALAVAAVVVFHSSIGVMEGGWLGVDVFFVLSGFLITALLLREHDRDGGVSLVAFYARRVLRLLPALFVLLVLLVIIVTAGALPKSAADGVPWVFGYASNWGRVGHGDFGPLDHLWSLSVEEQFYVVWPLALVALTRLRRREVALIVTAAVAVCVTVVRFALWKTRAVSSAHIYLGSDLRADALLYGCVLGIAFQLGWLHGLARWWRLAALPALAVLVGIALSSNSPATGLSPYLYAPIDLASAVLVAFVVTSPTSVPWLRARPLVRLGVVSYGIYLWHYPVMWTLAERAELHPMLVLLFGAPLAVTLALVSWHVVEEPALRLKRRVDRLGRRTTDARLAQAGA